MSVHAHAKAIACCAAGRRWYGSTYREVLAVQKRVPGPEHSGMLLSAADLAHSLYRQGKHAEAEQIYLAWNG